MRYFFHTVIVASILLWTGCGDDKSNNNQTKQNNTEANKSVNSVKSIPKIKSRFTITDIDNRSTTISFANKLLKVSKIAQPIVVINIFSDWSPPSRGMIPYLNDLQQEYQKDLFMIGILANSDMNNTGLREFMKEHSISYFISNSDDNDELAKRIANSLMLDDNYPVPLTVVIKDGEYKVYYVGATPAEMIKSDIEQLRIK